MRSWAIGGDALSLDRLATQKSLKEPSGSPHVPPTLQHQLWNFALVVDRALEKSMSTANLADHFVNVPAGGGGGTKLLQAPGDGRSEFLDPAPACGSGRAEMRRQASVSLPPPPPSLLTSLHFHRLPPCRGTCPRIRCRTGCGDATRGGVRGPVWAWKGARLRGG